MHEIIPEGKIKDCVDGQIRNDTPEEYVRQTIEKRLLYEHKYKAADIAVEYAVKIGSRSPRADIVIWDSGVREKTQDNIKIIIECKKDSVTYEDSKEGIEQLKSYMSACPNCEWGMWTNSISKFVFRKIINSAGNFVFEEYNDIPASDGNIDEINRPTREGLRNAADDNLLFVFRTCHNYIYANDGMHKQPAFFEFLKIIFCKIQDERNIPEPLEFYATSSERKNSDGQLTVKKRISAIFKRVKESYSDIFDKNDDINLTPRSLAYIVSELQRYNLLNTNIDIKGKAYEEIVGANLRGDRGEFFTPRNITKMVVEMLNPAINEKVLDSSCGTGGFLVTALTYMIDKLQRSSEEKFRLPREQWSIYQNINFRDRIREAAARNFFGFDLNLDLAKATRMNMVMNNDGSGNIYQVNSLLPPHEWPDAFKANLARALNIDPLSLRNQDSINLFDVIITNPPFGSKIPIKDEAILNQYELAHIWKRDKTSGEWTMTENLQSSVPPEILFVERCTQFLKDGGRMGIVLPDSILGSPGLGYIRHWILTNLTVIASIDLTPDTFQPHNGTQTSILILRKKTAQEKINEAITRHIANYPVFMAVIERVGHDRRGNTLYKRDIEGNELLAQDSGGKLERIIDDQTQILPEIFREWLKKKPLLPGQVDDIKFSQVWINEVTADKDLRLEAGVFNNEARQAFMIIENGRFGAVKFRELASSYLAGRNVRVVHTKTLYPFIQPGSTTDIRPKIDGYLYAKKEDFIDELVIHEGQILVTRAGSVGKIVYVSKTLDNKIVNQNMLRVTLNKPEDAGYIYAYLKSSVCQAIFQSIACGAVVSYINPEHLNDIPVPNAPQELRSRIHDLIIRSYALRDESNNLLDEAENILIRELALPPLDDMRRHEGSILAFDVQSQDLQGRFEASFHDPLFNAIVTHLKEHAQEVINLGDERITRKILLPGRFKKVYVNEGYGVISLGGKQINELDPSEKKYLAFSQHDKRITEELTIHENMILVTRSGTLGNIALVPKHWEGWAVSEHVLRVIPESEDTAGYMYVFLASDYGRELITRYKYGAVIDEINDEHLASVPFPLLKDKDSQALINSLALEANSKRFEACNLEREAMKIMEDEIICANVD